MLETVEAAIPAALQQDTVARTPAKKFAQGVLIGTVHIFAVQIISPRKLRYRSILKTLRVPKASSMFEGSGFQRYEPLMRLLNFGNAQTVTAVDDYHFSTRDHAPRDQ